MNRATRMLLACLLFVGIARTSSSDEYLEALSDVPPISEKKDGSPLVVRQVVSDPLEKAFYKGYANKNKKKIRRTKLESIQPSENTYQQKNVGVSSGSSEHDAPNKEASPAPLGVIFDNDESEIDINKSENSDDDVLNISDDLLDNKSSAVQKIALSQRASYPWPVIAAVGILSSILTLGVSYYIHRFSVKKAIGKAQQERALLQQKIDYLERLLDEAQHARLIALHTPVEHS